MRARVPVKCVSSRNSFFVTKLIFNRVRWGCGLGARKKAGSGLGLGGAAAGAEAGAGAVPL